MPRQLATPNLFIKKDDSATPNFQDENPSSLTLWTSKFFYSARYLSMVEADMINLELELGFGIYFRDTFQLNRITCLHSDEEEITTANAWKITKAKESVETNMSHAADLVCQAVTRKNVELWYLTDAMWVNLNDKLFNDCLTKTHIKREEWD